MNTAHEIRRLANLAIPKLTEPDNPYSYDPWEDDTVDPTNLDEVVVEAASRGWSMGAYHAREEIRRTMLAYANSIEEETE